MSGEIEDHSPALSFEVWRRARDEEDEEEEDEEEEEEEEQEEAEVGSVPCTPRATGTSRCKRQRSSDGDCGGGVVAYSGSSSSGGRGKGGSDSGCCCCGGSVVAAEPVHSTCLCTWTCGRRCVLRCGSACSKKSRSSPSGRCSSRRSSFGGGGGGGGGGGVEVVESSPVCVDSGDRKACKEDCWLGRFYCIFLLTMALLSLVVIVVCVTTWRGVGGLELRERRCPQSLFQCRDGVCLNNSMMCDGIPDCPDMSDEEHCDPLQKVYWNFNYVKRPEADRDQQSQECQLEAVPEYCQCRNSTRLYCENAGLQHLPPDLPRDVTVLDLSRNPLSLLGPPGLRNLSRLRQLYIMHASLTRIAPGAFESLTELSVVYLTDNSITEFPGEAFPIQNKVVELKLSRNRIRVLGKDDLRRLGSLESLSLDYNHIVSIHPEAFKWTPKLKQLFLNNNRLTTMNFKFPCLQLLDLSMNSLRVLPTDYFAGSSGLRNLYLKDNGIEVIEPGAFNGMKGLFTLSLSGNSLVSLKSGTFAGLDNLEMLVLSNNKIVEIDIDAFNPMKKIQSIDLTRNPLRRLSNGTFTSLHNLSYLYFDKFYLCVYARNVKVCLPAGDGISSFENLLENGILRVSVWMVALLACGGNLLVLLGRCLMREDNQSHSFFIKNLSLADMLTGIYLLVIGSRDLMYRGDYLFHDEEWRNSWECDLCGVLSAVSSEVSVLTLTVITLDRYICISYPLALRRRGLRVAYSVMGATWTLCILLASLPLMGLDYFGNSFYRDNAVCIPLHLHEPRAQGWEYSTFLFLGVNLASFAFITYAYTAMFIAIKQSDVQLRTSRERRERCLVKRFFFIVITDFACWIPIIVIKAIALAGVELSNDLYAWVVVFILPVNSALNPLLYTLTTRLFREKLLSKLTTVVWRPNAKDLTLTSSASTKARNSLTRHAGLEVEMKPLRQNRKSGSPMRCGTIR